MMDSPKDLENNPNYQYKGEGYEARILRASLRVTSTALRLLYQQIW
jgi:hypothetical protein